MNEQQKRNYQTGVAVIEALKLQHERFGYILSQIPANEITARRVLSDEYDNAYSNLVAACTAHDAEFGANTLAALSADAD